MCRVNNISDLLLLGQLGISFCSLSATQDQYQISVECWNNSDGALFTAGSAMQIDIETYYCTRCPTTNGAKVGRYFTLAGTTIASG